MSQGRVLAAAFLLSAGSLLFEVSLTRLLSISYYSGFVFTVLSAALLGLGLGAAAAARWPALRQAWQLARFAALSTLSIGLLTVLSPLAAESLPLLSVALSVLPFFFVGLTLSSVFSLWPRSSHLIYWADLSGAGSGTLLALPLLGLLSAASTALLAGLLCAAAALLFSARARLSLGAAVLLLALLGGNMLSGVLEPDPARLATGKPLTAELQAGAQPVAVASDAFARSDLIVRPATNAHYLYLDGAAGSLVPLTDDPGLRADIGYLAFEVAEPKNVFLLGVGGGLDAALARLAGTERIVAAELNGAGLELVRSVSGTALSRVELLVDEGRSVLRNRAERFDLIFLSHVITQTGDLRGFALSEASTYTVEAFTDYLDHLNPGGLIALKLYDELTLSRAFFTAYTALAEAGAADPAAHLFAALDQTASAPLPLLLVSNKAFSQDRAVAAARAAEQRGHALLYVPGLLANPPLDRLAAGEVTVAELTARELGNGIDVRPVRDEAPFFFQFEVGLPQVIVPAASGAALLTVLSLLLLIFRRQPETWPAAPLMFAALGAGYIALQLGFIQRSQLLLGHPTLALSLVLIVLLLGGGLGSLLSRRMQRPLLWAPLLVVILSAAWHLLWPLLSELLSGGDLAMRATLLGLSLLPVALALGVPLPAGLRRLEHAPERVAAAWAVNGVHSVTGSVLAISLALLADFRLVLVFALGCYLLVLLSSLRSRTTV